MIVRKSNSRRVPPSSAREPRPVTSTTGRGNLNHNFREHSPVNSKLSDELRDYLANQPRLVLIGVNGVARPFFHLPFHPAASSQTGGENNAR